MSDFLDENDQFGDTTLYGDDLFAIFQSLDSVTDFPPVTPCDDVMGSKELEETARLASKRSRSLSGFQEYSETALDAGSPKRKRAETALATTWSDDVNSLNGRQQRMAHITVERNRRKQMNEQLSVLRSLMPNFYVKRGDQASIIGGAVDYINELQQILQSLEAKKQRKVVYSEVLSPRLAPTPRPSPVSPRKPPASPRLKLPISPTTPTPSSPYKPWLHQHGYFSPTTINPSSLDPSPSSSSSSINDTVKELAASSKSAVADVEVGFAGANVLLKTASPRIPGQAVKIIAALEDLALEILHVHVNTVDDTMLSSFTIKIGIECQLSADELAQQIQQTFLTN